MLLADAGIEDRSDISMAWFANCGMGSFGQRNIRGQVCFSPLVREVSVSGRVPTMNVEGGCATAASQAFHGAWKDIASGDAQLSLAIGVEDVHAGRPCTGRRFSTAASIAWIPTSSSPTMMKPEEYAERLSRPAKSAARSLHGYLRDAGSISRPKRYGTTQRQIAAGAAKTTLTGASIPLAQYRFKMTVDEVLADREISYPLTRSMCAPIGDGAAAALVCSKDYLAALPSRVRERSVKVRASAMSGGKYRSLDEPGLSRIATRQGLQNGQAVAVGY